MKKRLMTLLLAAAVMLSMIPAVSTAASMYIIPDSNTRKLTWDELMEYQYDTLKYAFNEIYARHGYKFNYGSPCYNWFTLMPWYTPNESESPTNHHETYSQCSKIENYNVDLIKEVRRYMKSINWLNPHGKGMPTPPDQRVDTPRGFRFVNLKAKQKLPVYSAPSTSAYRANNGKATCSTNDQVFALGFDNGWMLMLYEANYAGQYRVGYVQNAKGDTSSLPRLTWDNIRARVLEGVNLTDDPALTGASMTYLPAGTEVLYLTTMYNSSGWDYIETQINGQTARGFVPAGSLDISADEMDPVDELVPVDGGENNG